MEIRNIIFDLGGVLYNINYNLTAHAFKSLDISNFDDIFTQASQLQLFDLLDKGAITPDAFRNELRNLTGLPLTDQQIDNAWNAMLLEMHPYSLELLAKVKGRYRTFLLSDTNQIHFPVFLQYLIDNHNLDNLKDLFEEQYLSFEMGMRKPDVEIFNFVIRQNGLIPSETLFIDDTPQHVAGARKAGLRAYWLNVDTESVADLFENGQLKRSFLNVLQNQNT